MCKTFFVAREKSTTKGLVKNLYDCCLYMLYVLINTADNARCKYTSN